ncbi:MAG: hypothetical protein NUV77_14680 [Thermoguttaceae bacterium]|nr:hypothetical protein [Thermoguttaceae bacterium]
MKDLALVLAILAGWIVLNRWVLPWFGVPTCMGGCCRAPYGSTAEDSASTCGTVPSPLPPAGTPEHPGTSAATGENEPLDAKGNLP